MRVLQKNKGCRSYLEISGIGKQDSYACRMLINNNFKNIPECEYRNIDNEKMLLYKIDGLSLVSTRYGRISPEIGDVMMLMRDLSNTLTEIEDYMLSPDDLVIDMRNILYDTATESYRFLYVPDSNGGFIKQVKTLIEDIMVIYDHDDREGTVRLYDFYSKLLPDNFTPEMFKQLSRDPGPVREKQLERETVFEQEKERPDIYREPDVSFSSEGSMDSGTEEGVKKIYITGGAVAVLGITAIVLLGTKGVVLCLFMVAVYMIYAISSYRTLIEENEIRKNILESVGNGRSYSGGSTAMNSGNDLMTNEIRTEKYRGQRVDGQKKSISGLVPFISENEVPIMLTDDAEIRIGRQPGVNEYCLAEPGISRMHAVIRKTGTRVSVRDEGSTNGTYVNNRRISGEETELNYGDVVSFAGVEYYCV